MAEVILQKIHQSIPALLSLPSRQTWMDYDQEADVLYLHFQKPEPAAESELNDDDMIVRKSADGAILGVTVLHASTRS